MSKYLINPVQAFKKIRDNYIMYIETAFGTRFDQFNNERAAKLDEDRVLCRQPWIELLPQYKSNGTKIKMLNDQQLVGMDANQQEVFRSFIRKGLIHYDDQGFFEGLYVHQEKMLQTALSGKNCVITSGTGSGKTESFLLPLLAQIVKEIPQWAKPNPPHPNLNNWWHQLTAGQTVEPVLDNSGATTGYKLSTAALQRSHETRPAAVRALLLYPMNALVEDQMTRLRQALDAEDVKRYMDENFGGNRIYFGRYNSSTPVSGKLSIVKQNKVKPNQYKIEQLKSQLGDIEKNMRMVDHHLASDAQANEKESLAIFQRLYGHLKPDGQPSPSAEMRSRFDMQESPPDILITNYSMLGIMMMRDIDQGIFKQTKDWLEADKSNVFHLVIDELHLYRGTSGTEIAYLVRILLSRLGLSPDSDQLRILASSASLDDSDQDSVDFLKDFFGVTKAEKELVVIKGEYEEIPAAPASQLLPVAPFSAIRSLFIANPLAFEQATTEASACAAAAASALASSANFVLEGNNGLEQLCFAINHPRLNLRSMLQQTFSFEQLQKTGVLKTETRAIALFPKEDDRNALKRYFSTSIFGDYADADEATEGLVIARGIFDILAAAKNAMSRTQLPRFRFHYFFRNIEGLWATVDQPQRSMPVGRLHHASKLVDEDNGNKRVLEMLYCESCGTVFYGGKRMARKKELGAILEMISTSPKIEGLPEQSVQVLIERRSYSDYVIFWPLGDSSDNQTIDSTLSSPDNPDHIPLYKGSQSASPAWEWIEASLNMYSGDVVPEHHKAESHPETFVKGYLFQVADLDADPELGKLFQALPGTCPHCATDRFRAKTRRSPVRGFRAGFSKTSQIFAKELFYQLPDGSGNRKLVSFSDSREDAASISNGIERNHYTDLLRDEFIRFGQELRLKTEYLKFFEVANNAGDPADADQKVLLNIKSLRWDANNPDPEKATSARQELDLIRQGMVAFESFFSAPGGDTSAIIRSLFKLGINPAGCNWQVQSFETANGSYEEWTKCFNANGTWSNDASETFKGLIQKEIRINLAGLLFGRLFYGLESSAFGWTTIEHQPALINQVLAHYHIQGQLTPAVFQQIMDSVIRILAESYRHSLSGFQIDEKVYSGLGKKTKFKKYIKAAAGLLGISDFNDLGNAVTNYLDETGHTGLKIRTEKLFIRFAGASSLVYECNKCKKVHLHPSGGVCTFCQSTIQSFFPRNPNKTSKDVWANNYLAAGITQQRNPIKLHCEELTGQTDDQFQRQRHFRDFIFEREEGPKNIRSIDILSVTTTLEVGVDIGSLQAVMLANMPPQRFNYQQRVGRGGRRGQAYSVILTLCRGRSHDEFYFANPHRITGDAPPVPFLSIGQEEILKRLLVKEVLYCFFKNAGISGGGTHGEFGSRGGWAQVKLDFTNWLNANRSLIHDLVLMLNDGATGKCPPYEAYVHNELAAEIDLAVINRDISAIELSETLAEAGLLPMFGMPSRVRVMYAGLTKNHGTGQIRRELSQVDRPLDMAVTEFFPGAQKTKDKKIITSIGFTPGQLHYKEGFVNRQPIKEITTLETDPFTLRRVLVNCIHCKSFFKTFAVGSPEIVALNNTCECGMPLDNCITEIRTPSAFRTDFSPGENSEEETSIQISRPSIFAEAVSGVQPIQVKNAMVSLANLDMTWRINDQAVTGRIYKVNNSFPFLRFASLQNQWIIDDFANPVTNGAFSFSAQTSPNSVQETIKIAANKVTNVFRINPQQVPEGLILDPFVYFHPPSLGVKAAYYSAAFILQRAVAQTEDVDPTEIEITDIVAKETAAGHKVAQIILADELPNGSGFVKALFDNLVSGDNYFDMILSPSDGTYFDQMIQPAHASSCRDACYECLKVYRNMPYHGIIDWRLGMALLRLMYDDDYKAGIDKNFNHPELQDWQEIAAEVRDNFMASFFPGKAVKIDGIIPGLEIDLQKEKVSVFFTHPFWDTDASKNPLLGEAVAVAGNIKYHFIDTFNALRRPGWCYESLMQP